MFVTTTQKGPNWHFDFSKRTKPAPWRPRFLDKCCPSHVLPWRPFNLICTPPLTLPENSGSEWMDGTNKRKTFIFFGKKAEHSLNKKRGKRKYYEGLTKNKYYYRSANENYSLYKFYLFWPTELKSRFSGFSLVQNSTANQMFPLRWQTSATRNTDRREFQKSTLFLKTAHFLIFTHSALNHAWK